MQRRACLWFGHAAALHVLDELFLREELLAAERTLVAGLGRRLLWRCLLLRLARRLLFRTLRVVASDFDLQLAPIDLFGVHFRDRRVGIRFHSKLQTRVTHRSICAFTCTKPNPRLPFSPAFGPFFVMTNARRIGPTLSNAVCSCASVKSNGRLRTKTVASSCCEPALRDGAPDGSSMRDPPGKRRKRRINGNSQGNKLTRAGLSLQLQK